MTYNESSFFEKYAEDYIKLKKSIGFKFETETGYLKRLLNFLHENYPDSTELTKEMVIDWCKKRPYEQQKNLNARVTIIRQFAKYLNFHNVKAYIIPKGIYKKGPQYTPHIYTDDELRRFFKATDLCHVVPSWPWRHLIMPLFFRMIYTCGLRCSEARLLKFGNVDLENGVLKILSSKNDKDRLVPMNNKLTTMCRKYVEVVHKTPSEDDYFFPSTNGGAITPVCAYTNFRRFLRLAGIQHYGRGKGPRIHDFRHTFCCRCLKKWVKNNEDLNSLLPILKAYVGHHTFNETAYYLRMTADVFDDIRSKLESVMPDVIPEAEVPDDSFE